MISERMSRIIAAQVAAREQAAGQVVELAERRRRMQAGAERMPTPAGVTVEPVDANGVPCEWIRPAEIRHDGVLLYFHGGGYAVGGLDTHRRMIGFLASALRRPALSVGYRLAPEHPYPAAVDDGVTVLSSLVGRDVVVAGDSAGGGLAAAMCLIARENGLPMPRALVLLSPWLDMTAADDHDGDNAVDDPVVTRANLRELRGWYLGDPHRVAPFASPLRADLEGLPPTLIQVGGREVLRDDAVRFAERLRAAGVDARCDVWEGMVHVWHFYAGVAPEADDALKSIGKWLRHVEGEEG